MHVEVQQVHLKECCCYRRLYAVLYIYCWWWKYLSGCIGGDEMRLIKRGFLIATVASASIIMASCSASAEHETDERAVRAETVEHVNLPDYGALYL